MVVIYEDSWTNANAIEVDSNVDSADETILSAVGYSITEAAELVASLNFE